MTHDELLAKIDYNNAYLPSTLAQMVYAVVELHAPHTQHKNVCGGCWEEESGFSDYPCPTIQAIEKALE